MNTKSLMKYIASQLPNKGTTLNWIIRGEAGTDEIDENKNLIAVVHCTKQEEIIFRNFTYKLDCALTGQILLNALTQEQIDTEVAGIYDTIADFVMSLKYTDCDGAIVMEGKCGNVETATEELYYVFSIPFTLFAQF